MINFLEREAGHILILSLFTFLALGIWLKTGDKWPVELFAGPLLLSMRGSKDKDKNG